MSDAKELIFKIDAYTPDTLPMERLAGYMADLAALLGEQANVHFVRLIEGSTQLVHKIDAPAVAKVDERLLLARSGNAPADIRERMESLDRRLRTDNASGMLIDADGAQIIPFPGVRRQVEPVFGPFLQSGSIDGVPYRVGGRGDSVPVMLRTRDDYEPHCVAARDVARQLAQHLFISEVRCSGMGRWIREINGEWMLQRFVISGFEVLEDHSLTEAVASLRAVEGSGWRKLKDPWDEMKEIRGEDDGA